VRLLEALRGRALGGSLSEGGIGGGFEGEMVGGSYEILLLKENGDCSFLKRFHRVSVTVTIWNLRW
jgi:hypothetical protein